MPVLNFPFEPGYRLVTGSDLNRMIEAINASFSQVGGGPANPSVTAGLTAKNGSASTFMRSDAAPAIDQSIVPTWTGAHTFTQTLAVLPAAGNGLAMTGTNSSGVPSIAAVGAAADISVEIKPKGSAGVTLSGPTTVSGALTVSSFSTSGAATFGGNVNVAGNLGSAANTSAPSPTNSGITIGGAPTWAMQSFYDQSLTANNRTADLLWISGGIKFRFVNDARNAFLDVLTISGGQASGVTGITSTSGSGAWAHTGGFTVNGKSFAPIVASGAQVAQAANVNQPSFYAVPTSGLYRVSAFIVLSQAATTSSTLPGVSVSYTEATTGAAVQDIVFGTGGTGNTVGLHQGGSVVVQAQAGANLGYITTGYASSGATPMQFSVTIKVEFLQ